MKAFIATMALLAGAVVFISVSTPAVAEDYAALRCVIETHPNWPTVTDEELVVWANDPTISYRPVNAPSKDIWKVIIANTDFDVLDAASRDLVTQTLFSGDNNEVDISTNTTPESIMLIRVFAGTATLPQLNNAFTYIWSPCASIGWGGECHLGDIQNARNAVCEP